MFNHSIVILIGVKRDREVCRYRRSTERQSLMWPADSTRDVPQYPVLSTVQFCTFICTRNVHSMAMMFQRPNNGINKRNAYHSQKLGTYLLDFFFFYFC